MKPFIIVFGHEKGGTGKSTLCTNVTLAIMYANSNNRVVILDTDSRQATTYNFFVERKKNKQLICPEFDVLYPSSNDSKQDSQQEDIAALMAFVTKHRDKDYIIIDTAGSHSSLAIHSLDFANLLITPLSDSVLDINALVCTTGENSLIRGPYAETVFEQRKSRILSGSHKQLRWFLVRNRVPVISQENSQKCLTLLQHISKNIGAELIGEIKDRSSLKEMFSLGLSVVDLPKLTQDISQIKLNTFSEIAEITKRILRLAIYGF